MWNLFELNVAVPAVMLILSLFIWREFRRY